MQTRISAVLLLGSALSLVSACANSDGSIGRIGSPAWFNSTTPEMRTAYFSEICRSYGFADGTTEMSNCIQRETIAVRDDSNQRGRAAAAMYGAVTANY